MVRTSPFDGERFGRCTRRSVTKNKTKKSAESSAAAFFVRGHDDDVNDTNSFRISRRQTLADGGRAPRKRSNVKYFCLCIYFSYIHFDDRDRRKNKTSRTVRKAFSRRFSFEMLSNPSRVFPVRFVYLFFHSRPRSLKSCHLNTRETSTPSF